MKYRSWMIAVVPFFALSTGCFFKKPLPMPQAPQIEEYSVPPNEERFNKPPEADFREPLPEKEFRPGMGAPGTPMSGFPGGQ